ncbi:acyl-CoA reductase [Helicobacter bizzozeronii]|nr:acyl-CoA reductase [Helicobacter bizzozeronii]GMB93756.1 acyl-CoA reductase [Helicobacter bizzozeronii]
MNNNKLENLHAIKILFSALNGVSFCAELEQLATLPTLRIFDNDVCHFLNKLSIQLMTDIEAKTYSDMVAFGFFIRRANIQKLKQSYCGSLDNKVGRGLSFHIAPSNVPMNFAYSLVAGLLSGNPCVVRVSSKNFKQTEILCRLLRVLANEYKITDYIKIIQYPHSIEITNYLSLKADIRVIWGGDTTIDNIRKSPIRPHCLELCFANRYSICVINSQSLLNLDDDALKVLAQNFYNDTYLYDQNACSSPKLLYWLGKEHAREAKEIFWKYVWHNIKNKYSLANISAVDKLMTACMVAIDMDGITIENKVDNLISRIAIPSLNKDIEHYTCACGSFIESSGDSLRGLLDIVTKRFQTLAYFGLDPKLILEEVTTLGILGIDRIVPIGKTSDFSLIWDGYDLIHTMSRTISFE